MNDKAIEAAAKAIFDSEHKPGEVWRAVPEWLRVYYIKRARAAIAAYEAAMWRPIGEYEDDMGEVHLFGPLRDGSDFYQEVGSRGHKIWHVEWMDNCAAPTHFRPLPAAPESEDTPND